MRPAKEVVRNRCCGEVGAYGIMTRDQVKATKGSSVAPDSDKRMSAVRAEMQLDNSALD